MYIFLLFFLVNSDCPAVFCGDTSNEEYCVEYSSSSKTYSIQACKAANYTSPHPSHYSQEYPLECEYWIDSRYWESSSWQDYYGYALLGSGDSCDPYGVVSVCNPDKDLVCYCESNECSCTKGLVYGEACDIYQKPCIPGYVCSNKICTKKYTLKAGDRATNSLACAGGGPLVIKTDHFVCREAPQTLGGIPKKCSTNNDCISDTGTETTECSCGINTDGQAFCKLHYGDAPMVGWREAERDREYQLELYWKFVSINYPYLQGNIDSCLGDVWRDYYEYQKGKPSSSKSEAEKTVLIGVIVLFYI